MAKFESRLNQLMRLTVITKILMEEDEVLPGWELCLECWQLFVWDFLWVDVPLRLDMDIDLDLDLDLQEDHYLVP